MGYMEDVAGEHILVVEDDRGVRESLSDALTLEGYEVTCAENGAVALRHLSGGQRPCLILLDLMMPVMDGWTFRSAMLGDPALADIPVIVMTATRQYDPELFAACEVMPKPLQLERLLATVERYCLAA